ncbi:hypothetical protein DICVIV_13289 [Dictyocaulus viviparus]|uniref:Uncharacterized protein n=1 Tax=Dictyocaulus viviparus TaxID=29172 RepID=A0A0D8X865_DICVI|nr:hypothetical protein DICVIV_13289 [Dictyocaulus viviparus]
MGSSYNEKRRRQVDEQDFRMVPKRIQTLYWATTCKMGGRAVKLYSQLKTILELRNGQHQCHHGENVEENLERCDCVMCGNVDINEKQLNLDENILWRNKIKKKREYYSVGKIRCDSEYSEIKRSTVVVDMTEYL